MNVSTATATRPAGFWMPTRDQLIATYKGIVAGAEKNGTLVPMKHAPAHAEKYTHYNINDPRLLGTNREVYVIRGELYLKTSVVYPGAKAHWFKVGPAPLF
jgi:hypothetical protein